jgi:hypothetical protein
MEGADQGHVGQADFLIDRTKSLIAKEAARAASFFAARNRSHPYNPRA